jgi:hypothetical protein
LSIGFCWSCCSNNGVVYVCSACTPLGIGIRIGVKKHAQVVLIMHTPEAYQMHTQALSLCFQNHVVLLVGGDLGQSAVLSSCSSPAATVGVFLAAMVYLSSVIMEECNS